MNSVMKMINSIAAVVIAAVMVHAINPARVTQGDDESAASMSVDTSPATEAVAASAQQVSCAGMICPAFGGHNFCPTACGTPDALCLANRDGHWRCAIPQ